MAVQDDQLFDPEVEHSLVRKIPNKSTKTKARASLPDILYLKEVYGRVGIFTNGSLPKATQFGPLEAPLATKNQMDEPTFPMKLDIRKCRRLESSASSYVYYDTTDENMCNWMMLVQPATSFSEQNLCAYQNEDFVYFTTTKQICPHEELKVWYSPTYARFMSTAVLTPSSGSISVPKVNPGRQKPKKSKSTRRMQVYPNSLVLERDVRSIPPKKRGWKRTKRMDPVIPSIVSTPSTTTHPESVKKTSFTCGICHKIFKEKTKLTIHSVVHSSARNFLCHRCGATYKRKDKLREHEVRVHNCEKFRQSTGKFVKNLENYEFKCDQCEIGFRRRGMLISHIMKRHPGTDTDSIEQLTRPVYKTVRTFQCPYCDKVYKSNTKRKLHVGKHHPNQPLPQSLKRKNGDVSVQQDVTIITGPQVEVNPFSCSYCTMEYSMKHKLDKHIREKHPEYYQGSPNKKPKRQKPSPGDREQNENNLIDIDPFQNQPTASGNLFELTQSIQCPAPFSTTSGVSAPIVPYTPHQNAERAQPPPQKQVPIPAQQRQVYPEDNQNGIAFPYDSSYDGLLQNQILHRDSEQIHNAFDSCRTLEAVNNVPTNLGNSISRNCADLFNNNTEALQSISPELPTPHFINEGPRVMETVQPTSETGQQNQQQYNHNVEPKSASHHRYHIIGRKRILQYYKDTQLQQSQSNDVQFTQPLSCHKGTTVETPTYGRTPWLNEHRTSAIAPEMVPRTDSNAIYRGPSFTIANTHCAKPCAIRPSQISLDEMVVDNQRLHVLRPWHENDETMLMTTSRNLLFESEAT